MFPLVLNTQGLKESILCQRASLSQVGPDQVIGLLVMFLMIVGGGLDNRLRHTVGTRQFLPQRCQVNLDLHHQGPLQHNSQLRPRLRGLKCHGDSERKNNYHSESGSSYDAMIKIYFARVLAVRCNSVLFVSRNGKVIVPSYIHSSVTVSKNPDYYQEEHHGHPGVDRTAMVK